MKNKSINLTSDELKKITDTISVIEHKTTGELKVSIRKKLGFFSRKKSIHELAIEEFHRLKLNETREKTGLLFYILLERNQFYLVADKGLNEKLPPDFWNLQIPKISHHFANNEFVSGIINVLLEIGSILETHFPSDQQDNPNEISDNVEIR